MNLLKSNATFDDLYLRVLTMMEEYDINMSDAMMREYETLFVDGETHARLGTKKHKQQINTFAKAYSMTEEQITFVEDVLVGRLDYKMNPVEV